MHALQYQRIAIFWHLSLAQNEHSRYGRGECHINIPQLSFTVYTTTVIEIYFF